MKLCDVKQHFNCDGTGQMCNICGESEAACQCDSPAFADCKDCDGAGRFCVEHESPCGDLGSPPRCDRATAKAALTVPSKRKRVGIKGGKHA